MYYILLHVLIYSYIEQRGTNATFVETKISPFAVRFSLVTIPKLENTLIFYRKVLLLIELLYFNTVLYL